MKTRTVLIFLAPLLVSCAHVRWKPHRLPDFTGKPFSRTAVCYSSTDTDRRKDVEEAFRRSLSAGQSAPGRCLDVISPTDTVAGDEALRRLRAAGYDSVMIVEKHSMIHWAGGRELEDFRDYWSHVSSPAPESELFMSSVELKSLAPRRYVNGRVYFFETEGGRRVWWAEGTARADSGLSPADFARSVAESVVDRLSREDVIPASRK